MFADLVLHAKISVGPPFFNTALLPLVVPLVAATAAGPVLAWKRARAWPVVERLWWAALCALGAFLVLVARSYTWAAERVERDFGDLVESES